MTTATALSLSFFSSRNATAPARKEMTFAEFCDLCSKHEPLAKKESGRLFSPAIYPPGKTRGNDHVESICAFVIDGDEAGEIARYRPLWEEMGLAYLAYSTFSHSPEKPKWRAVFPFSTPVSISDPEAWRRWYRAAAERLGGSLMDKQCVDPARMYFLPACPPDMAAHAFCFVGEGRPLEYAEIVLPAPEVKQAAPSGRRSPLQSVGTLSDRMMDQALNKARTGSRNAGATHLAQQIRDNDISASEGERLMRQYANLVTGWKQEPFTERQALATLNSTLRTRQREAWEESEPSVFIAPPTIPPPSADSVPQTASDAPDVNGPGETLAQAILYMERRLKKIRDVQLGPCGFVTQATLDQSDYVEIGKAIMKCDERLETIIRFLWATWWISLDKGPAGTKAFACKEVFGDMPVFEADKLRRKIADDATTVRKLLAHLAMHQIRCDRRFTFYELLVYLPPDDWEEILNKNPYGGMYQDICLRYLDSVPLWFRKRYDALTDEERKAEEAKQQEGLPSQNLEESYSDLREETPLPLPATLVHPTTGEVLNVSSELFSLLLAAQEQADLSGVPLEDYLQGCLRESITKSAVPLEPPVVSDEDRSLIETARYYVKDRYNPEIGDGKQQATPLSTEGTQWHNAEAEIDLLHAVVVETTPLSTEGTSSAEVEPQQEDVNTDEDGDPYSPEALREEVRSEWTAAVALGLLPKMNKTLLSQILHRPIESSKAAIETASADDFERIRHYIGTQSIIPPGLNALEYLMEAGGTIR